jgi:hypothetical protein
MDCLEEGFVPHKRETWKYQFGELKEDTKVAYYQGYWKDGNPVMEVKTLPAGTTVRIVMASRFGDVGITEQLDKEFGYGARIDLDKLTNLRLEK